MKIHRAVFFGVCLVIFGAQTGVAAGDGAACGGIAGKKCSGAHDYCDIGTGKCKVADAAGTCKAKPEICTDEYVPVCGCDGKTYGNACAAAAKGVSVDHQGKCEDR